MVAFRALPPLLPMLHPDPQTRALLSDWLTRKNGALKLVRHLLEHGEIEHAEAIAAIALKTPDCPDRDELEALAFCAEPRGSPPREV